jgi:aminoglycoside/choline kinase family phosphotransferase
MEHFDKLKKLFYSWKNESPTKIELLTSTSASTRIYHRIFLKQETFIGAYNNDRNENRAFFHFSTVFKNAGFPVPEILRTDSSELYYIIEDLGDLNLLEKLKIEGESDNLKQLYKKSLNQLFRIQLFGFENINFEKFAFPRKAFDSQSILWDLYYFKYYFLKVSGLAFDEQLLENDFQYLASQLSASKFKGFMFRDFQARNIHIQENDVSFIDYQGGRIGPLLYDLASLLFQASAQLSDSFRDELKNHYFNLMNEKYHISREEFEIELNALAFIRIIQTLGAYGFRGLIEKKAYFINSIPSALNNLENNLNSPNFKLEILYFGQLLKQLFRLNSKFAT